MELFAPSAPTLDLPTFEVPRALALSASPACPGHILRCAKVSEPVHCWVAGLYPDRSPYLHGNGKGRWYPVLWDKDPEGNDVRLTLGQVTIAVLNRVWQAAGGPKAPRKGLPVRYIDGDPANVLPSNLRVNTNPEPDRRRHYHAARLIDLRFRAWQRGEDPNAAMMRLRKGGR